MRGFGVRFWGGVGWIEWFLGGLGEVWGWGLEGALESFFGWSCWGLREEEGIWGGGEVLGRGIGDREGIGESGGV